MSTKYGPGHPEMVALNRQIELAGRRRSRIAAGRSTTNSSRYQRKLENELAAIAKQLEGAAAATSSPTRTRRRRCPSSRTTIDGLKADSCAMRRSIRDKERERDRVDTTKNVGGYKVEDVSQAGRRGADRPGPRPVALLGAVFGLLLGGGLGLWAELADRSFRSPADIRRLLGVPGSRAHPADPHDRPAGVQAGRGARPHPGRRVMRPHSAEAEAVRGIRTQLLFSTSGRDAPGHPGHQPQPRRRQESRWPRTWPISLAKSGKRVVLVDCDFRKPRVHRMFAIANRRSGWRRSSPTRPTSGRWSRGARSRTCRSCRAARGRRTRPSCSRPRSSRRCSTTSGRTTTS